ncbi:MAG: hypothetical protein GY820_43845 [Gammaproteobacteria bacterium]|nr:hypothetical protein [Gammaproteobacteria bacterium]
MTVENSKLEVGSEHTVTACSTKDSQPVDSLLSESAPDRQAQRWANWASPLSENTTYSLFSENKLLIDQD